jgi:cephalosporin hydroxylase
MKLTLDTDAATLTCQEDGTSRTLPLYSPEAFELISHQWVRVGWDCKYPYTFTWLGRPIIQLPEDMVRIQEAIYRLKPDVVVETGIAHGGSLVFHASILQAIGKGRVIGVDLEIRPHNRQAIEAHELFDRITLIEGDSVAEATIAQVRDQIHPGQTVMVILDSNHTRAHVLAELEAYGPLVSPGCYLLAADGVMQWVHDTPRGDAQWDTDNPTQAVRDFLADHDEFELLDAPEWPFNESPLTTGATHCPGGWLRRK